MRGVTRNVLMGLLTVFMACLIISTATTTVTAADGWGTLKAGDEMRWQSSNYGTVTMEILSVEGKTISLELTEGSTSVSRTIDADESLSSTNMMALFPWLIPVEQEGDFGFSTTTYDFEGTTYQAYYAKVEYGGGAFTERWFDTNTGLLFEMRRTEADETVIVKEKLVSSTADMAASTGSYGSGTGGCLGTLLIALVSVTTLVSYSLLWKKKKL